MNEPSTRTSPAASRRLAAGAGARGPGGGPGLEEPVRSLAGVGLRRAELLARLGIWTVRDLLFTLPRRYSDRSTVVPIAALRAGAPATVVAELVGAAVRRRSGARPATVARFRDRSGLLEVIWWGQPYLARRLSPGGWFLLYGRPSWSGRWVMSSPEAELVAADDGLGLDFARIVPIYPLTAGLGPRWFRSLVGAALATASGQIEETLPDPLRTSLGFPPLGAALRAVHRPASLVEAERGRARLAFDELFELHLALGLCRRRRRLLPGFVQRPGRRYAQALRALPFRLTVSQRRVLGQILADLGAPRPMHRLLEGDVGCGKTVVALLAAAVAIDAGSQVALLAPTEVLAGQHARTARTLLPGVSTVLVTGALTGRERAARLADLASARAELVIGTQALLEAGIRFRRLGLAIVDEEQRFGVRERAALPAKGGTPDLLVMTATPIPRSLALVLCGDLDRSVLAERPPGRRPARTHVVPADRRAPVEGFLARALDRGEQVLVVTPRIEADPDGDIAAATERYAGLRGHPELGRHRIGLLHGRLPAPAKREVMDAFHGGALDLLVATTIVEVGLDVEAATVVLVEHPERLGLAQLHQLRGRVGRRGQVSHCILLTGPDLDPIARAKLERFARTEDGFEVAELDLDTRGPGALLGADQHGFGALQIADPRRDLDLFERARQAAAELIATDPGLERTAALGRAIRRRLAPAAGTPGRAGAQEEAGRFLAAF